MEFSKLFLLYSYEDINDLNHPYIIPLKLNQTIYFESEAFRMLNEASLPACDNIGFISPKILRNNLKVNNLSLDDYMDRLQQTYHTITPLYTCFGWPTHTLNNAVNYHGKNFQKIWDDLSYKIKITNFWYKDVKMFYKNAWIAKKDIVINYLKFIKPIFELMEEPTIKSLAFTDAGYYSPTQFTKEECIKKFGVPFYTLHPFIFERLICFYKFSIERNAKL